MAGFHCFWSQLSREDCSSSLIACLAQLASLTTVAAGWVYSIIVDFCYHHCICAFDTEIRIPGLTYWFNLEIDTKQQKVDCITSQDGGQHGGLHRDWLYGVRVLHIGILCFLIVRDAWAQGGICTWVYLWCEIMFTHIHIYDNDMVS